MSAGSVTAIAARQALEAVKSDRNFVKRYLDGDRDAFAYMQSLIRAAYPDGESEETSDDSRQSALYTLNQGGGKAMPDRQQAETPPTPPIATPPYEGPPVAKPYTPEPDGGQSPRPSRRRSPTKK